MDLPTLGWFILGLTALVIGAEFLVKGASKLARFAGISPLVIGLTVVAFGTSAPELAVSTISAWEGKGDIAFGNVVGSNSFNVLFILGVSALITPLVVARQLVRIDVPLMIVASMACYLVAYDGMISRVEGIALMFGLLGYVVMTVVMARRDSAAKKAATSPEDDEKPGEPMGAAILLSLFFVAIGLTLLIFGSRWLVEGAVMMARSLGMSELIIGLTIVAAGTSLPEVATSVMAAIRGERDIAVGNVVGSNIFNIFGVLGLSSVIAPNGIPATQAAISFDVPVMIAAAIACLPIFLSGHRINRWEGFLFLGYYVAYTAFLVLDQTKHDALPTFSWLMAVFILPLTGITLGIVLIRGIREQKAPQL